MTHILLHAHAYQDKAALFAPLAQRTLAIKPLAWKETDPLSHSGYVMELTGEQAHVMSQTIAAIGGTLLPVTAGSVEATLAAVGLWIVTETTPDAPPEDVIDDTAVEPEDDTP
jgi:hypothetical protein